MGIPWIDVIEDDKAIVLETGVQLGEVLESTTAYGTLTTTYRFLNYEDQTVMEKLDPLFGAYALWGPSYKGGKA